MENEEVTLVGIGVTIVCIAVIIIAIPWTWALILKSYTGAYEWYCVSEGFDYRYTEWALFGRGCEPIRDTEVRVIQATTSSHRL